MMRFIKDRAGGFSTSFALVGLFLAASVGVAVDYSIYANQRTAMKQSLETGVLAAVREAPVQGWDEDTIAAVVDSYVDANLRKAAFGGAEYVLDVEPLPERGRVRATLWQNDHGYFVLGHFRKNPQIVVQAEAAIVSSANICVLALDGSAPAALSLGKARTTLTARNCGVFVNSTDRHAIHVEQQSTLSASQICTAGGYDARLVDMRPQPQVDCPVIPDPLAGRTPPSFGACDYRDVAVDRDATLHPGVYCGGLDINGSIEVKLTPGLYVIKDGPWTIGGNATLSGENVGFYLTGSGSTMSFENSSNIALTAPRDGPMAGMLIFEDRASPPNRVFEISSKDAEMLLGTIYLPKGKLYVRGKNRFAGAAAWTAIIAREIVADDGPAIELNSDYAATDIPVPEGVGAVDGQVRLTQ